MKDVQSLSKEELQSFIDSFDTILSDVHGVLLQSSSEIPGASKAVNYFQSIGKRVIVVSNNSIETAEEFHKHLQAANFDINQDNIITPIRVQIYFLKQQNFSKQIFLIGSEALKASLIAAGFKVEARGPFQIETSFDSIIAATNDSNDDVGAVIIDTDFNVNFVNLQIALGYLKNPNVLFLKGASDRLIPLNNEVIIGSGNFTRILEELSGREAILLGKPGAILNEYILKNYCLDDPSRVLFIGDSVQSDMSFATAHGYQKLLVLSGVTKHTDLQNWTHPIEHKPDFFVNNLQFLYDLIQLNIL